MTKKCIKIFYDLQFLAVSFCFHRLSGGKNNSPLPTRSVENQKLTEKPQILWIHCEKYTVIISGEFL